MAALPINCIRSSEVSSSFAATERGVPLGLLAHGDGSRDPLDAGVATVTMVVGHPCSDLRQGTRAASEGTTIATSCERLSNHDTTFAVLNSSTGGDRGRGGPGTGELDTKISFQFVSDESWADVSGNGDSICDRVCSFSHGQRESRF